MKLVIKLMASRILIADDSGTADRMEDNSGSESPSLDEYDHMGRYYTSKTSGHETCNHTNYAGWSREDVRNYCSQCTLLIHTDSNLCA